MRTSIYLSIYGYSAADLTLADVVAAVESLERQSGGARAATKLHLWIMVRNPKHSLMSHIAAAETSEEVRTKLSKCSCLLVSSSVF